MVDELVPSAVTKRTLREPPPPTSKVLQRIAKGFAIAAVWVVKHPEVVVNIVRQIKAEQAAKQQKAVPR